MRDDQSRTFEYRRQSRDLPLAVEFGLALVQPLYHALGGRLGIRRR